jgi:transcriptional regulator with XRE-family HTH domain
MESPENDFFCGLHELNEGLRRYLLRLATGYRSQAEFARVLGVSPQDLNAYTRGKRRVGKHFLLRISHKLKIPMPVFTSTFASGPRMMELYEVAREHGVEEPEVLRLVLTLLKQAIKEPETNREARLLSLIGSLISDP